MKFRQFKQSALRALRSSVPLTSMLYVLDGLLAKVTHSHMQTSEHLSGVDIENDYRYARTVANHYLNEKRVSGRVAEVGPGGNAAVALNLLASGAESVDLLDRFTFTHDNSKLNELYRSFDNYDDLEKVRFHTGEKASAERFFDDHRDFDAIFSCAVLEHVSDPIRALQAMIGALKPGGKMVHQVDLRDHGMFTSGGKHELTFLTIPDSVYRIMSEPRGRPNRVTLDAYRELLENSPVDYRLLVVHLVGVGQLSEPLELREIPPEVLKRARDNVAAYRPRLIKRFREKAVDDLIVASFRVEAVKRDQPGL